MPTLTQQLMGANERLRMCNAALEKRTAELSTLLASRNEELFLLRIAVKDATEAAERLSLSLNLMVEGIR